MVLPTFINAVPNVLANKYKSDAMVLMNDIDRFFDGNKNCPNVFFTPFSAQEDVFLGIKTDYYKKDGTKCDEGEPGIVHTTSYPYLLVTDKHWVCGSYNPNTDTWEKNETEGYSYEYTDSKNRVVKCQTPGEYFLRCIYEYGADVPASEVKFPTYSDGSKLYITFVDKTNSINDLKNELTANKAIRPAQGDTYSSYKTTCHPIGILEIRSSNPRLRTTDKSGVKHDYVYYTYQVINWDTEKIEDES